MTTRKRHHAALLVALPALAITTACGDDESQSPGPIICNDVLPEPGVVDDGWVQMSKDYLVLEIDVVEVGTCAVTDPASPPEWASPYGSPWQQIRVLTVNVLRTAGQEAPELVPERLLIKASDADGVEPGSSGVVFAARMGEFASPAGEDYTILDENSEPYETNIQLTFDCFASAQVNTVNWVHKKILFDDRLRFTSTDLFTALADAPEGPQVNIGLAELLHNP